MDQPPPTKPGYEANYAQPAPPQPQPAANGHPAAPPPSGQHPMQPQPQPMPGLPVRGPAVTPAPGTTIIAYRVVPPKGGCNCDLRMEGWLVVIILILVFPCVACIPCFVTSLQQSYQEPVYGHPGQVYHEQVPVAQPV
jgi:hypothetical protein